MPHMPVVAHAAESYVNGVERRISPIDGDVADKAGQRKRAGAERVQPRNISCLTRQIGPQDLDNRGLQIEARR